MCKGKGKAAILPTMPPSSTSTAGLSSARSTNTWTHAVRIVLPFLEPPPPHRSMLLEPRSPALPPCNAGQTHSIPDAGRYHHLCVSLSLSLFLSLLRNPGIPGTLLLHVRASTELPRCRSSHNSRPPVHHRVPDARRMAHLAPVRGGKPHPRPSIWLRLLLSYPGTVLSGPPINFPHSPSSL